MTRNIGRHDRLPGREVVEYLEREIAPVDPRRHQDRRHREESIDPLAGLTHHTAGAGAKILTQATEHRVDLPLVGRPDQNQHGARPLAYDLRHGVEQQRNALVVRKIAGVQHDRRLGLDLELSPQLGDFLGSDVATCGREAPLDEPRLGDDLSDVPAEAGALATGARLEWTETRGYSNMVANGVVADVFARHLRATGRVVDEPRPNQRMGSTDMGDISQIMPAVHAYLSIAPRNVPNHTVEFTAAAASPAGDQAVIDGALAMARTAADLFADPSLVEQAKAEFQEKLGRGEVAGYDAWQEAGKQYAPAPRPA